MHRLACQRNTLPCAPSVLKHRVSAEVCLLEHQWISRGFTLRKVQYHQYMRSRKIHWLLITQEMTEDLQIDFFPRNVLWAFLWDPTEKDQYPKFPSPPPKKKIDFFSDSVGLCHAAESNEKLFCHVAESNEKLFWKLVKSQRSSSQMSAFLVNGDLLTDKKAIRAMWADHFEALDTPSEIATFDKGFFTKVTDSTSVREVFSTFVNDPNVILCEPMEYEEVARVCSTLKLGVSGVEIDDEHIRYAGPPLWKLLFQLYQNYFDNFSVCDSLLTGVILPLFKGKGAKANNKDNYRGITLFPTLCKVFEMVLLKRLENFAEQMGLFSNMQFGFKQGVGCTKASFTILESINHMLERGNKVFSCFLDVRKAFDTAWIDGLLFKLFSEFGIRGRMW